MSGVPQIAMRPSSPTAPSMARVCLEPLVGPVVGGPVGLVRRGDETAEARAEREADRLELRRDGAVGGAHEGVAGLGVVEREVGEVGAERGGGRGARWRRGPSPGRSRSPGPVPCRAGPPARPRGAGGSHGRSRSAGRGPVQRSGPPPPRPRRPGHRRRAARAGAGPELLAPPSRLPRRGSLGSVVGRLRVGAECHGQILGGSVRVGGDARLSVALSAPSSRRPSRTTSR